MTLDFFCIISPPDTGQVQLESSRVGGQALSFPSDSFQNGRRKLSLNEALIRPQFVKGRGREPQKATL